jgi:hypothetical protein
VLESTMGSGGRYAGMDECLRGQRVVKYAGSGSSGNKSALTKVTGDASGE